MTKRPAKKRIPKRKKHHDVARTAVEADDRGHEKTLNFRLDNLNIDKRNRGLMISAASARPGDIAWAGPCINGMRIVCYYDVNMDPSDCRNVPC